MKKLFFVFLVLLVSCNDEGANLGNTSKIHTHNAARVKPIDQYQTFEAYAVSMDGPDGGKLLGVPEFVTYHIKRSPKLLPAPKRPSKWFETPELDPYTPSDDSYKHSGYSRGHMCMKQIAWRRGAKADRETFNTANACPQLQKFNAGIWLDMENKTQKWADKYGEVWVVCGPAFKHESKIEYIGDPGEMKVAIPHYFWKIVFNFKEGGGINAMAFIYPHKEIEKENGKYNHLKYATNIDTIESITKLDFFGIGGEELESTIAVKLWK